MRAAIYVRVSTVKQSEEGASLQTQEQECRRHCGGRGYEVVAVYQDVKSGALLWERSGLSELRDAARRGEFDVVVVNSFDRLARRHDYHNYLMVEFAGNNVEAESVTEPADDTFAGKIARSVFGHMAEYDRIRRTEATQRGHHHRREQGKLRGTHKALYGYVFVDGEKVKERYEEDVETAATVRRIFRDVAAGVPLGTLARNLTAEGIRTPSGRGRLWSRQTLRALIGHEAYVGEGAPALVSPGLAEAANERITKNVYRSSRPSDDDGEGLLRRGFAVCGHCLGRMTLYRNRPGNILYRCEKAVRSPDKCRHHSLHVEEVDADAWAKVVRVLTDPGQLRTEIDRLRAEDTTEQDVAEIDRQLAEVERQIANVTAAIATLDGAAPLVLPDLLAKLEQFGNRRGWLETERARIAGQARLWDAWDELLQEPLRDVTARTAEAVAAFDFEQRRAAMDWLGVEVRIFRRGTPGPRWLVTARVDLDKFDWLKRGRNPDGYLPAFEETARAVGPASPTASLSTTRVGSRRRSSRNWASGCAPARSTPRGSGATSTATAPRSTPPTGTRGRSASSPSPARTAAWPAPSATTRPPPSAT
ncbi:MAG: recombinase family protein [Chloroflexota bacterium]|nr:recombinase family protein [Chloroflexota bacterium]